MSAGCYMSSFDQETLSGKTFCSLKNVCYQYLNFVLGVSYCLFLRAADWPTGDFLGGYCYIFLQPDRLTWSKWPRL